MILLGFLFALVVIWCLLWLLFARRSGGTAILNGALQFLLVVAVVAVALALVL